MLRYTLEQIRIRGRNLRHVLIVGTNPMAIRFAQKIEKKPELGYRLIGFVDDEWDGTREFRETGYALASNFNDLPAFLRDRVVDEVVISLPMNSFYQEASRIVALCEEQGIRVRFLSNIFNVKRARLEIEQFEDDSVVTVYAGTMDGWPMLVKRILDFCLSLVLLIILAPLFFITAFLIKVTSPGRIFFMQERVGLGKRRFRLYKFRTMIPDAEQKLPQLEHLNEVTGPVFKIKNDPRITSIGRFLRRTSIDELPQLINVLRGDMSLVGPRPLPVRDHDGFDQDWQRRRFSVRPGITCLWQVNGRSNISFEKWMELDMQYIDQWSLWLDFKILCKTIPAVLRGSGAA
jgi:exopolysaccharide biosynthesis polyprenyl glycosylphosphotransferase